ncbi:MAG: lasso RiPP family leader peptide-containing protein [Candidatus Eisenbacteria bacterium]
MENREQRQEHRFYEKPELVRHGTLKDITLLSRRELFVGDDHHPTGGGGS